MISFHLHGLIKNLKKDLCPCNLSSQALIYEQHKTLSKMIPSMYVSGIVSMLCLMGLNLDKAPAWAIIYLPGTALAFSFWRLVHWVRVRHKLDAFTFEERRKDILMVIGMSPVLSLAFALIAIMIMQGGDIHEQALSAVLLWGLVGIAGYSMSSVPLASTLAVVSSSIPLAAAFIMSGDRILQVVSVGYIALSLMSFYILIHIYRAFSSLVYSRSELREKHKKVHKLAYSDHLTGLANRQKFKEEMIRNVKEATAQGRKMAVCILDLDSFRHINNLFNHDGGDKVLVEFGERLRKLVGNNGVLARLSSDEFHILAHHVHNEDEAEEFGKEIHKVLRKPFFIDGSEIRVTASVGIAIFPEAGSKPSQLVKRAAQAQRQAKLFGGGKTRIFTMDFEKRILERSRLLLDLKAAIEKDEIEVYFQPIVNLETG
ncbi:MAG TPA: diguanylate cyclase, partial [Rhizobiales bacterium]|nr:diguanylate cyclase [Hyphomicrobiales bacterium]